MAKTVHLIRHAQSTFNVASAAAPFADPMLFDAPLSPHGHDQVAVLRDQVAGLAIELVVVSPLTRAVQTALGAFGGRAPILVEPLLRERVEMSCDIGRSPAALAAAFPELAFDHLDDPWWYIDPARPGAIVWEPDAVFEPRVAALRTWLAGRPEQCIAMVGHGTFLRRLAGRRLGTAERLTLDAAEIITATMAAW